MKLVVMCATLSCASFTTGCGDMSNQIVGVPPTLQQSNLTADQSVQDAMVDALIRKAGLTREELRNNAAKWTDVADAGLLEVDIQCDRYLAALFTFNREQRAGRQILTAAGAGTAAIMGLTGAAGAAIAITAAAFGMAASVFDAGAGSVLFTVSPVAVRAVANKGRQAFLAGIKWDRVNSRPRMMMVVQGYLSQCTPAAIEANIDNAATGAPSVASTLGDIALQAAALGAPSSSVVQDPKVFSVTQVSQGGSTKTEPPPDNRAKNVAESEKNFIQSKDQAIRLQLALGVPPDGDLGPTGGTGATRTAIKQFKLGLMRSRPGDPKATATDLIDSPTNSALLKEGTMTGTLFKSAFERTMLGDPNQDFKKPSGFRIERVIGEIDDNAAQVPATTDAEIEIRMKTLRDVMAKYRKDRAALAEPPPAALDKTKPDSLDSAFYDYVMANRPKDAIPGGTR